MLRGGREGQASSPWRYTCVSSPWAPLWVPALHWVHCTDEEIGSRVGCRRDLPQVTELVFSVSEPFSSTRPVQGQLLLVRPQGTQGPVCPSCP